MLQHTFVLVRSSHSSIEDECWRIRQRPELGLIVVVLFSTARDGITATRIYFLLAAAVQKYQSASWGLLFRFVSFCFISFRLVIQDFCLCCLDTAMLVYATVKPRHFFKRKKRT